VFLKKTPQKNGRIHLAIAQSYRKDGKPTTRTLESLGYLDDLNKVHGDAIAHYEAECVRRNAEDAHARQTVHIDIHPAQKIDMRTRGRKNIGCAVALSHYHFLGIEHALRNAAKDRGFGYDPNAIMRLLVVSRLLNPGSKRSDWSDRDGYFFKSDFSEADMYRCLSFFAENKERILAATNRTIEKSGRRDMRHVYYDVTNHHFESEVLDELRQKGIAKSHRPDPIVQMGLLQDAASLPITYRLFAGNTNDCLTMLPVLRSLKRDYGLTRVIVVADKGLNTSDNIAANILDGNGFVFSQSIRGTKSTAKLRRWVVSDTGYEASAEGSFKVKSRLQDKTIHVTGDDGKTHDVDIPVKVVAFWSAKYEARSRHKRAETLAKARELVASPAAYSRATHKGAVRYVKNISFDKETGEVLEDVGKHAELDEVAITEAEACDGYYCIVTSETDLADLEIIDIYKGLWRIEDAFKITKSEIETRPVFVWTPEHIEAHFLVCYLSLLILRLIQQDFDFAHSAACILSELKAMSGSHLEGNWWLFDHRTELSDALCKSVGIDLSRKYLQLKDIKSILASVRNKG
jgi:hypothetical protein